MAKKVMNEVHKCGPHCCSGKWAWLVLILGVIFLLKDLGTWDFWGINWWTIVFLLMGLGTVFKK